MAVQISGNDITVPRDGTFTRNVTIGGTLTYEDVTNIDSVGLITARTGIEIGARPGVAASISVDGNMIVSGISTFGGDVFIADKIIHDGDTNTSIRFPEGDHISFEVGATGEAIRIDNGGKFLIGLETRRLFAPGHTSQLQIEGTNSTLNSSLSIVNNQDSAGSPNIRLGKTRGTSIGSNTSVADGDNLGQIIFYGADGTDIYNATALIGSVVNGTVGTDTIPTDLVFQTSATTGSGRTERLRIGSSGKITATLGSANSDIFEIVGHASQGRTTLKLTAGNATANSQTSIRLARSNGNQPLQLFIDHDENHGNIFNGVVGGFIKFHVNESGSSLVRNVMTDTGHFINCRGTTGRIAFGTGAGVIYSGFGRYDGAAQDVGISHFATTNAGTTVVEHFRMEHNGTLKGTDTSIGSLSDIRLKTDIKDYSYDISKFKQFKPKSFNWINPEVHGDKSNVKGFIAQDIELVDKDWVEDSWISEDNPDFALISNTTDINGAGETVGVSKISKFGYKDAMYISVIQQLIDRIETLESS